MPSFGSLFSGIGGMDLGLEWAGWECRFQVEIDDWRRQVLTRHWPEVPKWKDVRDFPGSKREPASRGAIDGHQPPTDIGRWEARTGLPLRVDLICAGVPCQDVSVAGRRAGLAGERTGLFFEFARILRELQPRWFLFENVPGLLSSNQGLDFAVILDTLDECGYGVSWRILNSQFFGVPQRRRRVFIVGHLGGPCPPEILFESEGGGGHPQTGRETGEGATASTRDGLANPLGDGGNVVATATYWDGGQTAATLARSGTSQRMPDKDRFQYVCAPADPDGVRETTGDAGWLDACTRCPDGRRYAALGDAVTAVVAGWIGRRILSMEAGE